MEGTPFYMGRLPHNPNVGSSNQTSGIASRWIDPLFGQPISQRTNRPVKTGGDIIGFTPSSAQNTSEIGALQRIDSAIVIKEANDRLALAPKLPNQNVTVDQATKNRMLNQLQIDYMAASRENDVKKMSKILEMGQRIHNNQIPVRSPPQAPPPKPQPAMIAPTVVYKSKSRRKRK